VFSYITVPPRAFSAYEYVAHHWQNDAHGERRVGRPTEAVKGLKKADSRLQRVHALSVLYYRDYSLSLLKLAHANRTK